jgi:hypothetical protein
MRYHAFRPVRFVRQGERLTIIYDGHTARWGVYDILGQRIDRPGWGYWHYVRAAALVGALLLGWIVGGWLELRCIGPRNTYKNHTPIGDRPEG